MGKAKIIDWWWTKDYSFIKHRGNIDFVTVTRFSDDSIFILEEDHIKWFLETDEGLDAINSDKCLLGHYPLLKLSKKDIAEDYNKIAFAGQLRRVDFNVFSIDYYLEAQGKRPKSVKEGAASFQLFAATAMIYSGLKGYEKKAMMNTELSLNDVLREMDNLDAEILKKIGLLLKEAIADNPLINEYYQFQPLNNGGI